MSYFILFIVSVSVSVFTVIGREIVGDIRNPHKGQANEENSITDVPKIKTRKMYSYYER